MAWSMTSGPMPSPPMTAMREIVIESSSEERYEAPFAASHPVRFYGMRQAGQGGGNVMRGAASGGRVWGLVILGGLLALAGCTTPAGRPSLPSTAALEADPLTGGDVPIP